MTLSGNYLFRGLAFLLLAALNGAGLAAEAPYLDWVEPGSQAYQLLQQGAQADGSQGWVQDRLKSGKRLPQASARELSFELQESPRISESLKRSLKLALPYESHPTSERLSAAEAEALALKGQLTELDRVITDILETKKRNNYSPGSNPQINVEYSFTYKYTATQGLKTTAGPDINQNNLRIGLKQNYSNATLDAGGILVVQVPQTGGSNLTTQTGGRGYRPAGDTYEPELYRSFGSFMNFYDMHFSLTFDPDWFRAIKLEVGAYYLNLGSLIGTGRLGEQGAASTSFRKSPFFSSNFLIQNLNTEDVEVTPGSRIFQGFHVSKSGAQGWWIFDQFQAFLQPYYGSAWINPNNVNQQDTNFGNFNTWGMRLNLTHRNLPPLEDANLWLVYLGSQTETDFTIAPQTVPLHSDQAFGLGFSSVLGEGGQYGAEIALSNWYNQGPQSAFVTQDLAWQDTAYSLNLSKSFMPLSFVMDYGEVGSRFVVGPRNGLWTTNGQFGRFLDSTVDDPRPGNDEKIAWQTMAWDSQNLSNNSRRVSLNASYVSGWGSVALNPGFSTQLQPSGPWIQTARYMNNNWLHGMDWAELVFINGPSLPGAAPAIGQNGYSIGKYNLPTYGSGTSRPLYHGIGVNRDFAGAAASGWNWQDTQYRSQPSVFENLLLSQNGLGDPNLREESVKTVNFLRLTAQLDLQAIFDMELPLSLQGYSELRSVDEQLGFASYDDKHLLAQQVSEAFLSAGLTEMLTFQGYGGYETWLSTAGYYPLESRDLSWGVGFDVALSRYLNGLNFNARYRNLSHEDANFAVRNWTGYNYSAQARFTY